MPDLGPKANDKAFLPPTPEHLENSLDPARLEARDAAEKIRREKLPKPVAFEILHEIVGPWSRAKPGDKPTIIPADEIRKHFSDNYDRAKACRQTNLPPMPPFTEAMIDDSIARLTALNAIRPLTL